MKKINFCIALVLSSTTAISSDLGWLNFTDIPETRKHLLDDAVTVFNACEKKESYNKIKNFAAIEYVIKACSVSKKFPIDSLEKRICSYLSKSSLEERKQICVRQAVGQKYSEEDLEPKYKQFLAKSPTCNDSSSCFNQFLTMFSLEHANEFDCSSKFRLSYDLICEIAKTDKKVT